MQCVVLCGASTAWTALQMLTAPGVPAAAAAAACSPPLSFGPKNFIIISDPAYARQILQTNADKYSKGILRWGHLTGRAQRSKEQHWGGAELEGH
jgi:hypothetical protein